MHILFLAKNRLEFTRASLDALIENTNWSRVSEISLYDDGSIDGTWDYFEQVAYRFPVKRALIRSQHGSPVAAMNDFITRAKPELFAKIDNDVVLPPLWLDECLKVMDAHPELDLLGIEAMRRVVPGEAERSYEAAPSHIGGIGLFRGRAFAHSLPRPDGRFGFTAWQDHNVSVIKGWLNPALPVILLDRLPFQPWATLSGGYVAKGWQRPWAPYDGSQAALWEWWK